MSRIQQVTKKYLDQLFNHEQEAVAILNNAHAHALSSINSQLAKLYKEISDEQNSLREEDDSSVPKLSRSWMETHLRTLQKLISNEIDHFGALALMQTGQMQRTGVQLGNQSGQALLQSTVPVGVKWSFGVPSSQAIASIIGATQSGSPLADLFSGFGAEAADKASQALITGVTTGQNPRDIAPLVQQALDISRARALTIARTEMLRAYRTSQVENYKANDDVVEKMVRIADLSARSCAACIALNGKIYSLDEDPGFHPNDRCTLVPKTESWAEILGPYGIDTSNIEESSVEDVPNGAEWFDNQDEATQRSILGSKASYDLYASGKASLSDFVGTSHSQDWGKNIFQKSAKQVAGSV